jgi:hypothetical protein
MTNKEYWFDTGVWFHIKGFAGWSDSYPVNLPYYKFMTGYTKSNLPCCYNGTSGYSRSVNSLDTYIDRLIEICEELEDDLMYHFIPKRPPKTIHQMRIEWDDKYGEGDFDENGCW